MELKHYLSVLRKYAWLLVAAPLLASMASFLVSQQIQPLYRASVTLLVSPASSSASLNYNTLLTTERVAKTYAELLTKRPLLEEVIRDMGLDLAPRQLAGMIDVIQPSDTQLLELRLEGENPQFITDVANGITTIFLKQHNRRRIDRSVYVEIVEPAAMPATKLRPRLVFNTLVAAFAALILALGFIFLLDYMDDTLTHPQDVEKTLSIPTLATIPLIPRQPLFRKNPRRTGPLTASQPLSPFAEAYRMLRTNVQFANARQTAVPLLITSALPREGKTTTVANLAVVMAQAGLNVLLVDADLRQPMLHQIFDISNEHGLADLLLADTLPDELGVAETAVSRLHLLPSGILSSDPFLPTPSELFGSARIKPLIERLSAQADILLFDSPPVLAVADAPVLATHLGGVLFVIASGQTARGDVQSALSSLQSVDANVIGAILTQCRRSIKYYYGRYSGGLYGITNASFSLPISLSTGAQSHSSSPGSDNGETPQKEKDHG